MKRVGTEAVTHTFDLPPPSPHVKLIQLNTSLWITLTFHSYLLRQHRSQANYVRRVTVAARKFT